MCQNRTGGCFHPSAMTGFVVPGAVLTPIGQVSRPVSIAIRILRQNSASWLRRCTREVPLSSNHPVANGGFRISPSCSPSFRSHRAMRALLRASLGVSRPRAPCFGHMRVETWHVDRCFLLPWPRMRGAFCFVRSSAVMARRVSAKAACAISRWWSSAHTGLTASVGHRVAFLRRYFGTCFLQSGFVEQSFVVPAAFDTRNRPAFPANYQKSGRLGHLRPAPAWRHFARR